MPTLGHRLSGTGSLAVVCVGEGKEFVAWNCSPLPQIHVQLEPWNATLFGNKVFADVIS